MICITFWTVRFMPAQRRFPPPWSAEVQPIHYVVRDPNKQQLAYVYYENEPGRRAADKPLTRDEARRIAVNMAKLPELWLDSGTATVGLTAGPRVIFWAFSWRNRISSGGERKCATLCSQSRSSWQSQRSREPYVPTWSVPPLERVRALWLRVLSVRSQAGLLGVCSVGHIGDRQLAIAGSTTVSVAIARIIGITDE
jgi:hypothetical protein